MHRIIIGLEFICGLHRYEDITHRRYKRILCVQVEKGSQRGKLMQQRVNNTRHMLETMDLFHNWRHFPLVEVASGRSR